MKKTLCLYFQVHQPLRLRQYRFFDIGTDHDYYDEFANRSIMRKVADRCYLPANKLMLELIKEHGGNFKISFSISGMAIEQFEKYAPEVLDSFRALAKTGCVEFLSETYAHSLASLKDPKEFRAQVEAHSELMQKHFKQKPETFRNTELIYSDDIGEMVLKMGYTTMLTEGARHVMGWKSPHYVYTNAINPKLKLLLKDYRLSDDIAFRFSNRTWSEWPLTAEKYVGWLDAAAKKGEVVNLFMDYETFGEHQSIDTGIFAFLRQLPAQVFAHSNLEFLTPKEVVKKHQPVAILHVPFPISWADEERDVSAWLGNELQNEAFNQLYALREKIFDLENEKITRNFWTLQASDHFYYMCTKFFSDGAVHKYFNPYDTPYEAFINYMNVLSDFIINVENTVEKQLKKRGVGQKKLLKLQPDFKSEIAKTIKKIKNSSPMKKQIETPMGETAAPEVKPAAKKPAAKKAVKKAAPKKAAAKKPAAKKVVKKAAPKKAAAKKPAAKKVVKKAAPKKAAAKKPAAKKVVKKAAPKKPAVKKVVKKAAPKKAVAKKVVKKAAAPKKAAAKKVVKKVAPKKVVAKKPVVKKAVKK